MFFQTLLLAKSFRLRERSYRVRRFGYWEGSTGRVGRQIKMFSVRAGMEPVMNGLQPLRVDVRVDLGGRYVGVPKQFLNDP